MRLSLHYQVNLIEHESNVNSVYRAGWIYTFRLGIILGKGNMSPLFLDLKMRTAGKHCDQSVKVMSKKHQECQTSACITHQ